MNLKLWIAIFLVAVAIGFGASPVLADGIIVPEPTKCGLDECPPYMPEPICPPGFACTPMPYPISPPRPLGQLNIRYHHVTVTINDQLATTRVDQVFANPNSYAIEGTYIFPLPKDAVISQFSLWIDGTRQEGKVLSAAEARQVYESYLRQMRDPALLEYVGRGAFQARVFPIPAGGERRIALEYTQVLTADNGLVRYVYPLNTEKFSTKALESVKVEVNIASSKSSIRAVYSPSHAVSVTRKDEHTATATYAEKNVRPERDFALYYSIGEAEALHLISYRDPGDLTDPDGYFVLLLAPRPEISTRPQAKDVVLVLDHSGSMEGEKFRQAQAAARYILNHLGEEDRFGVVGFSSRVELFDTSLQSASRSQAAVAWVDRLGATGSTDINRALQEASALVSQERPTYLIFMTDGLPTIGVTDSRQILADFARTAPANLRLFAFGVGNDVDTFLLDSLSQAHHGLSQYVRPAEKLDEVLSAFYERVSTPVLTDIKLDFGKMSTFDLYPNPLPDLFAGSQVVITGRYRQGGLADITLSGKLNGETQTFRFASQRFAEDSRADGSTADVPRVWAARKIGYLLSRIRLQQPDQESINQIVRLSIRFGIVTPYTSYLVTEPMPLGAANQDRVAIEAYKSMQTAPAPAVSGAGAVQSAAEQGKLERGDSAPGVPQSAGGRVRSVGARTFVLSGNVWMDTTYDPAKMKPSQVAFMSAEYLSMAASRPDIAAALALGEHVIVVVDGKAVEVIPLASGKTTPMGTAVKITPGVVGTPIPGATQIAPTAKPIMPTPTSVPPTVCLGMVLPLLWVAVMMVKRK